MKQQNRPALKPRETRRQAGCITWLSLLLIAAGAATAQAQEPAAKDRRLFYQQNCTGCHGADGSARTAEGKKLRGQDLTDPAWLKSTTDERMVKIILNGKFFGWAMPGYADKLTSEEAQRLVTDIIRKSQKGTVIAPDIAGMDMLGIKLVQTHRGPLPQ